MGTNRITGRLGIVAIAFALILSASTFFTKSCVMKFNDPEIQRKFPDVWPHTYDLCRPAPWFHSDTAFIIL